MECLEKKCKNCSRQIQCHGACIEHDYRLIEDKFYKKYKCARCGYVKTVRE